MRLCLKLTLTIALFAALVSATGRRMTSNLAYEVRVGLTCAFGDDADLERLVEETRRMHFGRPLADRLASARGAYDQPMTVDDATARDPAPAGGCNALANVPRETRTFLDGDIRPSP